MPIKLLKLRGLAKTLDSNIFALLHRFRVLFINGCNDRTSATRSTQISDTSGAPLSDAAGYPKLLRPRRRFSRAGFRVCLTNPELNSVHENLRWVRLNFQ